MNLSFYFDLYPWTKSTDTIYASNSIGAKSSGAIRYRIDIEVEDPAQPDEVINGQVFMVEKA